MTNDDTSEDYFIRVNRFYSAAYFLQSGIDAGLSVDAVIKGAERMRDPHFFEALTAVISHLKQKHTAYNPPINSAIDIALVRTRLMGALAGDYKRAILRPDIPIGPWVRTPEKQEVSKPLESAATAPSTFLAKLSRVVTRILIGRPLHSAGRSANDYATIMTRGIESATDDVNEILNILGPPPDSAGGSVVVPPKSPAGVS